MVDKIIFAVNTEEEKGNVGRYSISPLPTGLGNTVGNSIRRVLLTHLPGAAVTQMKVKGATHVFTTLKGVKEDLVNVMLNVKEIRFSYKEEKPITLKLRKTGKGEVKASDIDLQPGVKITNPDLIIATLTDSKASFGLDLTITRGVGYETADEHKSATLGVIGVDSVFTPVISANYHVDSARKGKDVNLDNLIIEVETDGSIKPKEALDKAVQILIETFQNILNPQEIEKKEKKEVNDSVDLLIEEIEEIPLRLANALKKAGYKTVNDLMEAGSQEVVKAKNVGEKSVDFLKKVLKKKGVELN